MTEHRPLSDGDPRDAEAERLWRRAQAGDETAYRAVLEALARRLRAYLRRRLGTHPDEVEDLLQETLLALHLQRASHDPELPLMNWALTITRYKLIDHWRRQGRRGGPWVELDTLDEAEQPAEDGVAGLARRDLNVLLARLPAAQRRAIELTRLEGLAMAEASAQTGVSVAALKVQVHRGLRQLAAWVGGRA